jgi:hypothetical protein
MMTRRLVPLIAVLVLASSYPGRGQDSKSATTKKREECSISGTVVTLAGSEPLRKVRVRLESIEDRTRSILGGHRCGWALRIEGP